MASSTIGAFEARTKFGELLRRVEGGEVIIITRDGQPVAQLRRYEEQVEVGRVQRAIDGLIRTQKGCTLGGPSIEDLVEEGRL